MKKIFFMASMFATLVFVSSALSGGYGAAGCGWGGKAVGDNNDKLAQWGAQMLNGVYSNNTFAMSSGTSGCGQSGLVKQTKEKEVFFENNYDNLAKEMAIGEGENLNILAALFGCSVESRKSFGTFTQQNFDTIFNSVNEKPTDVLNTLTEGVSKDTVLSSSCDNITI